MTQTADSYNAYSHLVEIKDKSGNIKQYLPAAWRLFELRLRYPNITIESEIILLDVEHNLVVIKAWIFDGPSYLESQHRASGTKQGPLSSLDKIETAAKARASRDFGISTELALDIEDESHAPAPAADNKQRLNELYCQGKQSGKWTSSGEMLDMLAGLLDS